MGAFDAGAIKGRMTIDKSQWDKSATQIRASQQKIAVQSKKTGVAFKGMWKQMAIGIGVTNLVASGIRGMMRQVSDTIQTGRDFEREWANVTTMLNISRTATEKMKHELRMLSPTLGDTKELARGMYQVLSASIEPAKAIKFLGEAAKSAKAGVTETKIAVDAMTTVINAYGMEAEAATEISDIMFGIVKRGKLTYDELATSLGTVVPVASTVGVNFKDLGAAIATLTRQGIVASKATMQLRQIFMAILKPSAEAAEIAEDLGIAMGKNALETQGLAGWFDILKEKTKGNADIITKIIPNVRALTAGLALVGKASQGYAADQEFMKETMGFTDEAFIKQTESIDFWLDTFKVATDKIKIAIYEGLVDSLRESIRTAEDFDKIVTEKTNSAANAVSLHVGTMVDILGGLGKAWKATDEFLFGWIDRLRGVKQGTDELAGAEEILRESLAQAGIEITDYTLPAMLTLAERQAVLTRRAELLSFSMNKVWRSLRVPSQIMADWDALYDLVETPGLDNVWEQQMSSMEEDTLNFMASIIPGMAFMVDTITDDTEDMGKKVKVTFNKIAGDVGMALHMIGTRNRAVALASATINTAQAVTKALSAYPPPISFVMAALQAAAGLAEILTIKKQVIPKAEKGAYLPSPAIIEAGHGPKGEVVLPLDKAPGGIVGSTYNFYFDIRALDTIDVDRWFRDVGAKQIEEIFRRNQGGITEKSEQYLSQYRR